MVNDIVYKKLINAREKNKTRGYSDFRVLRECLTEMLGEDDF